MMQESFRSPVVEPPFDYRRLQHMKLQNKYNITDVAPLATQGFLLATEESVLKIIKGEIFHVHSFKAGVDFIYGNESIIFAILSDNTVVALDSGNGRLIATNRIHEDTHSCVQTAAIFNKKLYICLNNGVVVCAECTENALEVKHIRLAITVKSIFISHLGDMLFYNKTKCVITEEGLIDSVSQFDLIKDDIVNVGLLDGNICLIHTRSVDVVRGKGFQYGSFELTEEKENIVDGLFADDFMLLHLLDNTYICLRGHDIMPIYIFDASLFDAPTHLSLRSDGQILFVSADTIRQFDGTTENVLMQYPHEIDQWAKGERYNLPKCLELGGETVSNYLASRIDDWFNDVPALQSVDDLYTLCTQSDRICKAFAMTAAEYMFVNANSNSPYSRRVWRNQFLVIQNVVTELPKRILRHLQATDNSSILVELGRVFGTGHLMTTDIITAVITRLEDSVHREMAMMMLRDPSAYILVDTMPRAAVLDSVHNIFTILELRHVMQSITRGYYDDWVDALGHIANCKGITSHMQRIFDALVRSHLNVALNNQQLSLKRVLKILPLTNLTFTKPNKKLRGVTRVFTMDTDLKTSLLNWSVQSLEDYVNCTEEKEDLQLSDVKKLLHYLDTHPLQPMAEMAYSSRILCIHRAMAGIVIAFANGITRVYPYIGSTRSTVIVADFQVTVMTSFEKLLFVGGLRLGETQDCILVLDCLSRHLINVWATPVPIVHLHCASSQVLFAIDSNRRVLFYNLHTGYVEKQLRAESLADNPIRVAYTHSTVIESSCQSVYRFSLSSGLSYGVTRMKRRSDFVIPTLKHCGILYVSSSGRIVFEVNGIVKMEGTVQCGTITNVLMWSSDFATLTTELGEIILVRVTKAEEWARITLPTAPILGAIINGVVVNCYTPTSVYAISIDPWRFNKFASILNNLCNKEALVTRAIALNIKKFFPPGNTLLMRKSAAMLIDRCSRLPVRQLHSWREDNMIPEILRYASAVPSSPKASSNGVMARLFDVVNHTRTTENTFQCAICQSKRVDKDNFKVGFLPCFHKFHSRCIQKLISKTPDLNNHCLHEYAMEVKLKCPLCRKEFTDADDIRYDSDINNALLCDDLSSDDDC